MQEKGVDLWDLRTTKIIRLLSLAQFISAQIFNKLTVHNFLFIRLRPKKTSDRKNKHIAYSSHINYIKHGANLADEFSL